MGEATEDRRSVDAMLAAAAAEWRTTFDAISDAVCLLDLEGRILRCNKAFGRFAGRTPKEVIGEAACALVHGGAGHPPDCPFVHMLDTRGHEEVECSVRGRWLSIAVDPVFGEGGVLAGAVHILSDVTERKLQENRIGALNRLLRTISEINQLIVRERDRERLLAEACQITVAVSGFRMAWIGFGDEAMGEVRVAASAGHVDGYFDEVRVRCDDTPLGNGPTGTAIRERRPVAIVDWAADLRMAPWLEAGARRGYGSSAAFPIPVRGEVTGALTVYAGNAGFFDPEIVDLLQKLSHNLGFALETIENDQLRLEAENALRESEHRFRALFERSPNAIFLTDPATLAILDCNEVACSMNGYRREELIGRSISVLHVEEAARALEDPDARRASLGEIKRHGSVTVESLHRRKDGSVFPIESSMSAVTLGGREIVMGIDRDITERRHLEEQLRQSQKMEAVGSLAGGVAHDFNNLLQALMTDAQLLQAQAHEPGRVAALARDLEQAISQGASLTRQLLLFSRRETAKPERLDLNDVVRDATRLLRRLVRANISLAIELAEERLPVEADRGQLQQVLMNLALNASDAMPEGGTFEIRTAALDPDEVGLWVGDSGHGIPDGIRDRIFEPFFTTKGAGKGTGLGLSVVHGIVTQHGGRIEVESSIGKGTTFKVILPRSGSGQHRAVGEARPVSAVPERGRGERILVVEDEDAAREGLREILIDLGYQVVAARSGEEAKTRLGRGPFDVLLTDLMLPGVAGPQLAAELQARWPDLVVILMSGYTEDEAVRRGVSAGAVRFLQKPFEMVTLAREVRAALDERTGA